MESIVAWAGSEPGVRLVLLVGSRAMGGPLDSFSDHDVVLFVEDPGKYASNDEWLSSFGTVLVMLDEKYDLLGETVQTRLVQYRDGAKIDFSICDAGLLQRLAGAASLPEMFDAGYTVLLDKGDWSSRLPPPTGRAYGHRLPTEAEYRAVVNEFWWEATYVAKHLARGETLPARYSSECVMRFRCLLPMLDWCTVSTRGMDVRVGPHGRGLMDVIQEEDRQRLARTMPGTSIEEGWQALVAMSEYFRDLSENVAQLAGFEPQRELAVGVQAFLENARSGGRR